MKNILLTLSAILFAFFGFGQTANNCGNYTSTGSNSSPYLPGTNTACNSAVPGTVNTNGAWSGFGCSGQIVSTVTGGPVTCLTVAYTAVNTDDYATLTTDTGGTLTITGVNVGVNGNVIGPYNCAGTGNYGDVMVTICSTIPFSTLTLTNTGCSSGWVVNCAQVTCTITNLTASVGACVPPGNYSTSGQVEFTGAPTSGSLIVEDCNGNQDVIAAPFTSPVNYTITGQNADGLGCDITAYFTADPACTSTVTYTAPVCLCNIDNFTANIGLCDQNTDTYGVDGTIEFTSPPTTGQLVVEVDNGTNIYDTIIALPFTSPMNWSISGIPSDGAASSVTVYFTADPTCSSTINYTAPTSCACFADIGTFTATITGSSNNNYVLCYGDQIDIQTNNDWVGPGEQFNPPGPTYTPGVSWLMYSCPPTVAVTPDPNNNVPDDPCFLGLVSDFNFSDVNDMGWINSYPPGTFTDNTIYWVPITMYDINGGTYSYVNGTIPCYELGAPFAVQYLPEFSSTYTEDCLAGTADITLNGGLPAIDGSNFTVSNLQPTTASFVNTTAPDGGTITISGLQGGDNWSFDVVDGNGCPYTVSGGPFPPLEDPGYNYAQTSWCTADAPMTPTITGVNGGTFTATPAGLDINAATGEITPANSTAGSYDVTYTTPGACFDDSTITVNISATPTVDPITDQTVCVGDNFPNIIFTGSAGATFDWTNDNTNIGLAASGTGDINAFAGQTTGGTISGTITVTPSAGSCVGPTENFTLTVNDLDDASFNYPNGLTYCQTSADPQANVTGIPGGTFTYTTISGGPTLDIDPNTGDIILANSDLGTYDITYNTNGGTGSLCPQTSTLQLTITPAPVADFTLDVYCANDADPLPTYINGGSGGNFTSTAGLSINATTGQVDLDASTPGTYTVTNTINQPGCALATAQDDITIYELPDATITGSTSICSGDPLPDLTVNITAGQSPWDLTYNFDGTPNTVNTATTPYTIAGAAVGTYDLVTITDANGCTNTISGQAVIDEFPTPVVNPLNNQFVCHDDNLVIQTFTSTPPGSTFSWTNTTGTDVGFGLSGNGQIGSFTGNNTGTAPVGVTVEVTPTSADGCVGPTEDFLVTVNPLPDVTFTGPASGCAPLAVSFTNTTAVPGQFCEWDFGDGTTAQGCGTVSHVYASGTFDVGLTVTSTAGCTNSTTYSSYVDVTPMPNASFTFSPQEIDVQDPVVEFFNGSTNADTYEWDFGDESANVFTEDAIHGYPPEPESYLVTMYATSANQLCEDTAQVWITIDDVLIFYVPNVFTPDGDQFNETFQPVFTSGHDPFDFHLTIFNRWGEIVFESYDATKGWNGHYGDGGLVQDGVYVWQIEFKENMSDKRHIHRGHVTVLK